MKAFSKVLPSSTNVKGSGTGSPSSDMNKISDVLVEVRSSVPNSPADIGAITAAQLSALVDRIAAVQDRLIALKSPAMADAFGRTALGAGYGQFVPNNSTYTLANNQISPTNISGFYSNTPTKTYNHYGQVIVAAMPAGADHPSLVINHLVDNSQNYRGFYSVANSRWELWRRFNGTAVMVAATTASAPTAPYTLSLKQSNGSIVLTVDGVIKINYSDSATLRGKYVGVYFDWKTTADNVQKVSNFVYGDV